MIRGSTHRNAAAILLGTLLLITACSSDAPATDATPAATTPSADATQGFKPQVTIFAPTAAPTATSAPTATPRPTVAPTETPSAQAAPTLAPGYNPFTGLPEEEATLNRRPLLIKLANTIEVRPQTGLQAADVVVEHYVEGGITRFTALYLTNSPEKVGSVRSCRLIDKELPLIFDTALMCSGMSGGVKEILRASPVHQNGYTMISDFGECESPGVPGAGGCPLFRDPPSFAYAPHNLWAYTPNAWAELTERDKNQPSVFHAWRFNPVTPTVGLTVTEVTMAYRSGVVGWDYVAATGLWARSLGGQAFTDKATGEAITADNVLALQVPHVNTLIQEDATGARSIEIQLWGEGPAKFFRDGRMIYGSWRRPSDVGVLELLGEDGEPYPLKPGNTWIQLVPPDLVIQSNAVVKAEVTETAKSAAEPRESPTPAPEQ